MPAKVRSWSSLANPKLNPSWHIKQTQRLSLWNRAYYFQMNIMSISYLEGKLTLKNSAYFFKFWSSLYQCYFLTTYKIYILATHLREWWRMLRNCGISKGTQLSLITNIGSRLHLIWYLGQLSGSILRKSVVDVSDSWISLSTIWVLPLIYIFSIKWIPMKTYYIKKKKQL